MDVGSSKEVEHLLSPMRLRLQPSQQLMQRHPLLLLLELLTAFCQVCWSASSVIGRRSSLC
jgi:hypothetical protein